MDKLRELHKLQRVIELISDSELPISGQVQKTLAETLVCLGGRFGNRLVASVRVLQEQLSKIPDRILDQVAHLSIATSNHEDAPACSRVSHVLPNAKNEEPIIQMKTAVLPEEWEHAMQRSSSSLQDFIRSYFMFHDLDPCQPSHLFAHLPLLSFVESFIYMLDERNERRLLPGSLSAAADASSPTRGPARSATRGLTGSGPDQWQPLMEVLRQKQLLTSRVEAELEQGARYWDLERRLCTALAAREKVAHEEVVEALRLKSFDYRVLNLLMFQVRGAPVNDEFMAFLEVSELLVEIADDLFDYEEDVLANVFNVYRMFLYIHGEGAAVELARLIASFEKVYEERLAALPPLLASGYKIRCREAVQESGGDTVDSSDGRWCIPAAIYDEEAFRAAVVTQD
mmetsp:Transcript_33697/g.63471  ORF Transcript_33697/g.63471 Transcript_33697/m.63471 type:complete len:400 (-) Transcript_33697:402-1601(-)|eukprot:CAMPEP_0114285206 /NCGR_PEP_ID=MMETSP0059-20121206/5056_1 /TAXON_ID=36894 /ORGANISM="Pyramimonas parkeae, Strain CCMP726" /LENGTH=399 /DNA_ID=CAMNT_0001406075 /DNA_START=75 /DNA_END=1277 /DNA_ORIENTATION=+